MAFPLKPPPPLVSPSQCVTPPFTGLLEPPSGRSHGPLLFGQSNDLLNRFSASPLHRSILYTAVKGPSPSALKLFSGWFPSELGEKTSILKRTHRLCPTQAIPVPWSSFHVAHSFAYHMPSTVPHVSQHRRRYFSALPFARHTCPLLFS